MFRIKRKKWQIGTLAAIALLLVPLLVAMGEDETETENDGALGRDAQSYAADYAVSADEALHRLTLQIEAGTLGAALTAGEPTTFGGLWIQHTPQFKVKAAFTESGAETLEGYAMSDDLTASIEAVSVDTSLADLIITQDTAKTTVARTSVAAEFGVNVAANVVDVYTLDAAALSDALVQKGEELPLKTITKEITALSSAAHGSEIHGGEDLTSCTTGFAVKDEDGTQGITTAGHCSDSQSRGSTSLTYKNQWWGGSYDLQWHTSPSSIDVRNLAYDGTNHRYINSGRSWDNQSAGDYVCKYGKTTHEGCGTIETKYYVIEPHMGNKWVLVGNGNTSDLSEGGDSGGPWFSGNVAVGVMTHEVDTHKAIYMAFDFIENVGLSLDTN